MGDNAGSSRHRRDNSRASKAPQGPASQPRTSGNRTVNRQSDGQNSRPGAAPVGHYSNRPPQQFPPRVLSENAFSNQFDVAHTPAAKNGSGLNAMGHQMAQALPPYTYRPEQQYMGPPAQQFHQQQRYSNQFQYDQHIQQSHVSMAQVAAAQIGAYGPGVVTLTGQPYFGASHPQITHGFVHEQPMGQQMGYPPPMAARMPMTYYTGPLVVNGQAQGGFIYASGASVTPFQAQPQTGPMGLTSNGHTRSGSRDRSHSVGGPGGGGPIEADGERAETGEVTDGQTTNIVRGPPRKPRQSGHAIWIGNLPPQTALMSLVQHVCGLTPGLESLFLISKSNCAFANFKDETACSTAQQAIHDSTFQSMRLVSRLRKSTVEGVSGVAAPTGPSASTAGQHQSDGAGNGADADADAIQDGEKSPEPPTAPAADSSRFSHRGSVDNAASTIARERYFILKSLTVEDLDLSVKTGVWATQSHNEQMLANAYKSAEKVFLIFSANKSGEYFGVARMTSSINQDPKAAVEFAPKVPAIDDLLLPRSYATEATGQAPKGSVIDDSARGTIFWEADRGIEEMPDGGGGASLVDGETAGSPDHDAPLPDGDVPDGEAKTWGKPFMMEWISTSKLPFYRTRGLRNPWNSNREVKIARDGTELEPSVGRRLVALFSNAHSQQQQPMSPPGAGVQPRTHASGHGFSPRGPHR